MFSWSTANAMSIRPVLLDRAPYLTALVQSSLSDSVMGSTAFGPICNGVS